MLNSFIYNIYAIMDREPYEILTTILLFVPDNIWTSMTCKTFRNILQNAYKSKELTSVNDPYVLSRHHKKYGFRLYEIVQDDMRDIKNHKCLNFIGDTLFTNGEQGFIYEWQGILKLLFANCIYNNASRPQYFRQMFTQIEYHYGAKMHIVCEHILLATLTHNSFDVFLILMRDKKIQQIWGKIILKKRYLNESDINIIVKELDMLMENKVMDANEILKLVRISDNNFKLRYEIMEYLLAKIPICEEEPIIICKEEPRILRKAKKPQSSFFSLLFGHK
jgi:hypothetical protein